MTRRRYEPPALRIFVETFREGLLSAMGHDLRLQAERAWLEVGDEPWDVVAEVDASSLRVLGALHGDGRLDPAALSPKDRRTIEKATREEVLHADRHPVVRCRGERAARLAEHRLRLEGALELHGRRRPLAVEVERTARTWRARFVVHQPDFGIRPYKAPLGVLRVKPDVHVTVELDDEAPS